MVEPTEVILGPLAVLITKYIFVFVEEILFFVGNVGGCVEQKKWSEKGTEKKLLVVVQATT
jgi:hypothetical protein